VCNNIVVKSPLNVSHVIIAVLVIIVCLILGLSVLGTYSNGCVLRATVRVRSIHLFM
jgi:hypothetical protein